MHYLILTPDGVGSTLLQRALTVYLNSSGKDYYNTHELLNGIGLKEDRILIKKDSVGNGYDQSLDQIKFLLEKNSANIVSRIADYHVYSRLAYRCEDYNNFYKFCNQYFNKILYCVRDPYEYALSWAIRNKTNVLNVYSIDERIENHGVDKYINIDLDYFRHKLFQYQKYQYWVSDNFNNAIPIEYNSLNFNIDNAIKQITENTKFNVADKFGVSLSQYSKILYQMSLKKQKLIDDIQVDKLLIKSTIDLYRYQKELIRDRKLISRIPIKMNTLQDKKRKILNFDRTIGVFNDWAAQTNDYSTINLELIDKNICQERTHYDLAKNSSNLF